MLKSFCFLLCLWAGTSWAGSITPCGGNSISTISGAAANNPSQGCGLYDLGFNTFNVGNLGDGNLATATASQVNLAASGGTPGATPTMAPIDLTFSSSAWTVTSGSTSGFTCPQIAPCNAQSGFVTLFTAPVVGQDAPSDGGTWGIAGVALPVASILGALANGSGIPLDAQIEVVLDVCVGVSSEAACIQSGPGANQTFLSVSDIWNGTDLALGTPDANCAAVGPNCNTNNHQLNFTVPYTQAFVDDADVFIIAPVATGGGDSYTLSLSSFNAEFDQADISPSGGAAVPEPGTFLLLAAGLCLVGCGTGLSAGRRLRFRAPR